MLVTIWMSIIVCVTYVYYYAMSIISINNLEGELIRPQYIFPLCTSPFQMSVSPEESAAFLDIIGILTTTVPSNSFFLHLWMQRQTVFIDNGLSK